MTHQERVAKFEARQARIATVIAESKQRQIEVNEECERALASLKEAADRRRIRPESRIK